jgi:hypothetical protein
MSQDTRKPPPPSYPAPAHSQAALDLDSGWDDDTIPGLELDDPMSESAFDRVTAIPELPSELYAKQVMEQGADKIPGPPALPVTERPEQAKTERPAADGGRLGLDFTGLELGDLDTGPAKAPAPPPPFERDARDPVLELDLSEMRVTAPPPAESRPPPPLTPREAELTELRDRYAMGDFTGALVVAEALLEVDANDGDALRYAQTCRDVLTQMYSARLGALTQRVQVAVPNDQIRWLSLDHRAGFVLSLIDGSSTVEEVLDISGMNRLDALRILYTLFDQRVIALS